MEKVFFASIILIILIGGYFIIDAIHTKQCTKCVKTEKQCYKTETYTSITLIPNGKGLMALPMTHTRAVAVDCSEATYVGDQCVQTERVC